MASMIFRVSIIWQILLLCAVLSHVSCQCVGQCPDGWMYFKRSCYLFADNIVGDWTEATHHCSSHHARLVKINDKEEDLFLQDMSRRLYKDLSGRVSSNSFHTGGTDAKVEGSWKWYSDESDMMYKDWAPGQPDTGDSQDCLFLTATDHYYWHDGKCSMRAHPLCEIELTETEIVG